MAGKLDIAKYKLKAKLKDRYAKQLNRLQAAGNATACVEEAVEGAIKNLAAVNSASLVIYGEPQSGKTEMMICLTAKLLDDDHVTIVHLMNDSVDLLAQNLRRFKSSGLAPAARGLSELLQSTDDQNRQELVVFCKKNRRDLDKLIRRLSGRKRLVVIDDEADYASPNSKINQGARTKINELVGKLIGNDGYYVGVTATPARLDLNNTFQNDTEKWVNFPPHSRYTGQDVFFPLDKKVTYRLTFLNQAGNPQEAQAALVRFLVSVAYLNCYENGEEKNYTMLVHTSGKKEDHEADRTAIEKSFRSLIDRNSSNFGTLVTEVYAAAQKLYPEKDADLLTDYVVENASRATLVVLNSERDRKAAGENATEPTSPFTIIIGGNIVSRGVTFPNLLSMFFTRNVKHRLQQDTYIQRARMFGARGGYLKHFELTIPAQLYMDWHKCFVFHRLALATIKGKLGSPVWLSDSRVSIAGAASINKATVAFDKGEMSFGMFDYSEDLDKLVSKDLASTETLRKLRMKIGNDALPKFLIDYIEAMSQTMLGSLAIHTASSIEGYGTSADQRTISRSKGLMGKSQMESNKFPDALHHVKIFYNKSGKAKVFYKFRGSLQFVQNLKGKP
ncbi:MAG: Z1 domain-containing protein [Candidatus Acidiferrales bacterium]